MKLKSNSANIFFGAAAFLAFVFFASCSTLNVPKSSIDEPFNELLEKRTVKINRYSGMTNVYQIHATFMSRDFTDGQIQILTSDYEWPQAKQDEERAKLVQDATAHTKIFLDFFLPDSSVDDLIDTNTVWRLFLDCDGHRYEGHVEKLKRPYAELLSIFPYHNKWTTPYMVTFNVPLATAAQNKVVFTVTGPVGSEEISFDHGNAIN